MTLKFGSLFSGIGGFDLGFERAGMECAWQVEIDDKARSVLAKHWPTVKRYEDVKNVGAANLESVDLICGGFPCQDLSVAGKRAGFAGERSSLWFEFHRILAELKPEWVVIENVPGLLSSNGGRDFAVLLQGLVGLRYGVCWRILDAQYTGVAQRRRRVFIVGHLGTGRAAEVLFERDGSKWDSPPSRTKGQAVAGTLKGGSGQRGYPDPSDGNGGGLIAGTLGAAAGKNRNSGQANEASFLVAQAVDVRNFTDNGEISGTIQSKKSGGWSLNYQNPIAVKIDNTTSNGWGVLEDGTAHTLGGATDAVAVPDRIDRWVDEEDRIRAIQVGAKSSTAQEHVYHKPHGRIDALTVARPPQIIGAGVRRLTPTECERLQGFPDGWTAGQSDSARYKQCGNAVCVTEAEAIGSRIVAVA